MLAFLPVSRDRTYKFTFSDNLRIYIYYISSRYLNQYNNIHTTVSNIIY